MFCSFIRLVDFQGYTSFLLTILLECVCYFALLIMDQLSHVAQTGILVLPATCGPL